MGGTEGGLPHHSGSAVAHDRPMSLPLWADRSRRRCTDHCCAQLTTRILFSLPGPTPVRPRWRLVAASGPDVTAGCSGREPSSPNCCLTPHWQNHSSAKYYHPITSFTEPISANKSVNAGQRTVGKFSFMFSWGGAESAQSVPHQ